MKEHTIVIWISLFVRIILECPGKIENKKERIEAEALFKETFENYEKAKDIQKASIINSIMYKRKSNFLLDGDAFIF